MILIQFFYLSICYHQNHLYVTNNISNSSTPGLKAMKLQDHLHYTDVKNELFQQKSINSSTKNIVYAEEKIMKIK